MHAEAPVDSEYLPAAQSMHVVAPVEPEYLPAAQSMHAEAPLLASNAPEYFPAAQLRQYWNDNPYFPAGQA